VQLVLHADELGHFAFEQTRDGYAGGLATTCATSSSSTSSFSIGASPWSDAQRGGGLVDVALQLRDDAVANLGRLLQIGLRAPLRDEPSRAAPSSRE